MFGFILTRTTPERELVRCREVRLGHGENPYESLRLEKRREKDRRRKFLPSLSPHRAYLPMEGQTRGERVARASFVPTLAKNENSVTAPVREKRPVGSASPMRVFEITATARIRDQVRSPQLVYSEIC